MIMTTAARTAYTAVRLPSLLAEQVLLGRLPAQNPVRLATAKVLGTVDHLVGRLLDDTDVAERGEDTTTRAAAVADAEFAFAAPADMMSTSALLPEIAPPAPAAVVLAAENNSPVPVMSTVPTEPEKVHAAVAAISAVHHAATDQTAPGADLAAIAVPAVDAVDAVVDVDPGRR